ncbi:MAG: hypothetical protein LC790_10115, partial [Actinobacteria bacterium]|nr:hypothetical protein [Actinomycetota bacterium]
VDAPTSSDDWYANLLWLDRRKCLLIVHAGTLFALFVADIRVRDLRPFKRRIVRYWADMSGSTGVTSNTRMSRSP